MAKGKKGKKGKKQQKIAPLTAYNYINKQRTLVFCGRKMPARFRHLVVDMRDMLPHSKKENKLNLKAKLHIAVNNLCEVKRCNNCIYFECKGFKDLYMWISRTPNGPSAKFLVQNLHTMAETKLVGNCLKGSRPFLFFDDTFETEACYQLLKELFKQIFGTPKGHPKSKPFIDHVIGFFIFDGRIWFRNYQIVEEAVAAGNQESEKVNVMLVEIGPRFCLNPVRIFSGSFGGATLWKNNKFKTPKNARRDYNIAIKKKQAFDYMKNKARKARIKKNKVEESLDVFTDVGDKNSLFSEE